MSQLLAEEDTAVSRLVRLAQQGDRRAMGRLVERFQRAVYGLALKRLGNHAEAQELSQEVFLRALRKIGQLREPECFAGWLRAITKRLAINRGLRRPHEVGGAETAADLRTNCDASPLSAMLRAERGAEVRRGMGRLGVIDRQTLEAFYFEGRTLLEMSARFECPLGTIKRRLHVARKRLARELEQ